MNEYTGNALFILSLVLLNGYFAAAEIALISSRRAILRKLAEEGSVGARVAIRLTEDPSRLLATIQIGITLVGFLASATAAVSLSAPLSGWFETQGIPWVSGASAGVALFLVTLLMSYITLVFGELAPKRLGLQRAETVAVFVSRSIEVLARVVAPLVWLLSHSTDLVARVLGVKPGQGRPGISEEEIKLLVTEQGSLLDEEKRMIHEIFELGDTVAREIMVPRVDMVALASTADVGEALDAFKQSGFSRLPVFDESPDRIVGVLLLKDLVDPAARGGQRESVSAFLREPVFVPETKGILPLLSDMRAIRNHMAIVVDEYGGTAGLVTIEDIVEEVIGDVGDEFDRDQRYITVLDAQRMIVDGRLPIEDAIALGLPVEESEEYETIAGWLLVRLGHIPVPGELVEQDEHTFIVQSVRRRRIARVRVVRGQTDGEDSVPGQG